MSSSVHHFDEARLASYLEEHIEGFQGPLTSEKFAGGQSNPTFLLSTAGNQYVLRRKPPGQLLKSAHAVDREYAVLQALKDTAVPVAQPYCLCEDDDVIGSMFYVMSYEPGRIFWNPALPELDMGQRAPMFDELIRVLAAMHDVDVNAVGLADYGKPGSYFERQLGRWTKQYRAAETDPTDAIEQLISWLTDNMPADDGQVSLIHGDYRLDNIIFHPEKAETMAVLDWELSTLGHPMADLAYFCMCLRLPPVGPIKGLAGLDLDAIGVPCEADIIACYCKRRGIERIEHWTFYLAFSFFRLAAIAQGVYKRALDGNASNENALQTGSMAQVLAQLAINMITEES
jgi:aminoglycoside phosphotransferase (APT) family kinase protein